MSQQPIAWAKQTDKRLRITHMDMSGEDGWRPLVYGDTAVSPPTAQPTREWVGLTDEDRKAAFESLPDMLDGFLKTWGWLHFSKAVEAKLKEKNT